MLTAIECIVLALVAVVVVSPEGLPVEIHTKITLFRGGKRQWAMWARQL